MINGKRFILLHVYAGQETLYYYIGDKLRLAFVRIGNESVTADRIQLKALVLKGSGRTYGSLPSNYRFEDMAFTKLRSSITNFFSRLGQIQSNASEFHVILWNLNYVSNGAINEKEFLKEDNKFRKEFLKAQRMIYKMISSNPGVTIAEMAVNIGVSDRQVRKYLKRMTDMKFIVREGAGRMEFGE